MVAASCDGEATASGRAGLLQRRPLVRYFGPGHKIGRHKKIAPAVPPPGVAALPDRNLGTEFSA
jgi:hypothetical protein